MDGFKRACWLLLPPRAGRKKMEDRLRDEEERREDGATTNPLKKCSISLRGKPRSIYQYMGSNNVDAAQRINPKLIK